MIKLSNNGRSVTVSNKGAKRGYTFVISTDAEGIEARCQVTKADCRDHMARLYHSGWR